MAAEMSTIQRKIASAVKIPDREAEEAIEDLGEALEIIPFAYTTAAYGGDYTVV